MTSRARWAVWSIRRSNALLASWYEGWTEELQDMAEEELNRLVGETRRGSTPRRSQRLVEHRREIRTVEHKGVRYGVMLIGTRKAHWRCKTPDGVRHRSIRAAVHHLECIAISKMAERVQGLAKAWHCKVSVA